MTAPLVVTDTDLREALDAWAAMRDHRDQARAWAVALEQENAKLAATVSDLMGQVVLMELELAQDDPS